MPKINTKLLSDKIRTSLLLTGLEKRFILNRIEGAPDQVEIPTLLNPSSEEFGMMVCSAVRDALGRMSYITGSTVDFVGEYIPYLSENTLQNINQDITHHQKSNDLGLLVDRALWLGLRDSIQAEIQRRKETD